MKRKLEIWIKSGEKTCAWEEGKFCEMCKVGGIGLDYASGHVAKCHLFGYLQGKDGWVQRHIDCIKLEPESGFWASH